MPTFRKTAGFSQANASPATVYNIMKKNRGGTLHPRLIFSVTRAACVCCSMDSLTIIAYVSSVRRHGKSWPCSRKCAQIRLRNPAICVRVRVMRALRFCTFGIFSCRTPLWGDRRFYISTQQSFSP